MLYHKSLPHNLRFNNFSTCATGQWDIFYGGQKDCFEVKRTVFKKYFEAIYMNPD